LQWPAQTPARDAKFSPRRKIQPATQNSARDKVKISSAREIAAAGVIAICFLFVLFGEERDGADGCGQN
jgi:hypothetical protein